MPAPRRYYPGFFGALFLVALRVAIGWHFLYEGTQKILSTPQGKASILARIFPETEGPPFTSEGYLRNASGPFAPYFRSMGDVEGRKKLDPVQLKAEWSAEMDKAILQYGFDDAQKSKAAEVLKTHQQAADDWFQAVDNRDKVRKYLDGLLQVEAIEKKLNPLSYEVENARATKRVAEAERKELVKTVDSWTDALRGDLTKIVTPEQLKEAGEYAPPPTELQKIDLATMWGLSAVGLCLMLGLFTPLAALGGAAYLLSFYLSMPPWPGLPEGITEGHYRYVNKNLIEMIACLALAATPNGLWVGVDALLFGWIGRGRRLREAAEQANRAERPAPQDRRKFKTR